LPTKYKLTYLDCILFVDETGCSTNQLNNGRVGGELCILPKNNSECGAPTGATTNLHYTVFMFISGSGEAVLCRIILKSDAPIEEIPISWKTGINIAGNVDDEAATMCRGPT
jgi:hypothetical protein